MVETSKIALSKLLKIEVPRLLDQVLVVLEQHNLEELHLDTMYNVLLEQKANANLLIDPYGSHPLTSTLNELHAKRLNYASLIYSKLQYLDKPHFHETLHLVKKTKPIVKHYLSYLGQKSRNTVLDSIEAFFQYLKDEPEVEEALIALGLQSYLEELQQANDEHEETWLQRLTDISQRPEVDTVKTKKKVQKAMRRFFDQVDSCQSIYKDVDYQPLISELNELLTKYSKMINTRAAINKRRAKKAKENKEKAAETKPTEAETKKDISPTIIENTIVTMNNDIADDDLMEENEIIKAETTEEKKEDVESVGNLMKKLKLPKRKKKK